MPTIMSSGHSYCVGADDGKAAGIQGFASIRGRPLNYKIVLTHRLPAV